MFNNSIKLSLVTALILSTSAFADDGFDEEDDFGEDVEIQIVQTQPKEKNNFTFYGSVSADTQYRYQNSNDKLSNKLSSNLKLEYSIDKYKLKSTINSYKKYGTNIKNDDDININEISIESTLDNGVDLKMGRQIVVWGKSDNIRITDTLNPLDNTAPGMVDIKDLRLGRTMTKLDYYLNKWSLSGIILHENRFSKMPKVGSDYYLKKFIDAPSNNIKNTGIALSLSANLEGQDIAFYYSNQFIDNTIFRSNMYGFAYNKVMNSFLFKTEIAYFDNYDSSTTDAKTDGLVGLEYNGIDDGSISLEIANKNNDIQYALRFTQSFINQTLDFTALYSGFGKNLEDGGFIRSWVDYAYDDDISLSFGIIDYIGGDSFIFNKIKDNDRIFTSLKYSF